MRKPSVFLKKLGKFIALRYDNLYISNLQFQNDLESCGLKLSCLGNISQTEFEGLPMYIFDLKGSGVEDQYRLIEFGNRLFLVPTLISIPVDYG